VDIRVIISIFPNVIAAINNQLVLNKLSVYAK